MTALTLSTRTATSGPVIELTGDLDHDSAPQVRAALPHLDLRPGQHLIVDLDALTFCDSSGITVLIAARNYAHQRGAGIALAAVPDRVRRVFRIVGLDEVFATYPTAHEAVAARIPPV
ncbi:STAS domain-containing protein [Streptomyces sp. CHD11]|uniref:STAS domain-containing protein n=1 Tax=Streptomyces sp. CHD11 TaxID=2741325 RepID=UPI001BFC1446|nr:STAS domain-containing protein [Streptomyces sp. CHD11]MBT3150138.1 STAS domain-containing protein [Streptomyces sp. CHD11]